MNHSQLPWKAFRRGMGQSILDATLASVASTGNSRHFPEQKAANAAYIVHAANTLPKLEERNAELEEALKAEVAQLETWEEEDKMFRQPRGKYQERADALRAVLAKEAAND